MAGTSSSAYRPIEAQQMTSINKTSLNGTHNPTNVRFVQGTVCEWIVFVWYLIYVRCQSVLMH